MSEYKVIVGNIGNVFSGGCRKEAFAAFKEYVGQSRDGYGRASHETVTLLQGDEPLKEFRARLITPSIKDLTALLIELKGGIDPCYRAFDDDDKPGMQVTIGCSYDEGWSYQTGDTSYTGGAYGHPYWGVGYLYRDSNCREVAKSIIEDAINQTY